MEIGDTLKTIERHKLCAQKHHNSGFETYWTLEKFDLNTRVNCEQFCLYIKVSLLIFMIFSLPGIAFAQPQTTSASAIDQLKACRSIADGPARLACFDRQMAVFDAAETAGEVAVIDRAQVQQTRRQLFGFQAPDLSGLLRGSNGDTDSLDQIETTLVRATLGSNGRWQFQLEDGSTWHQTDNARHAVLNRRGDPVRIRKASLGSYLMSVGRSRGLRVQRY